MTKFDNTKFTQNKNQSHKKQKVHSNKVKINVQNTEVKTKVSQQKMHNPHVLISPSFINKIFQDKFDFFECIKKINEDSIPCITNCIIKEINILPEENKPILKLLEDTRFKTIKCTCNHDQDLSNICIINQVTKNENYVVASSDKQLNRKLEKKFPKLKILYRLILHPYFFGYR